MLLSAVEDSLRSFGSKHLDQLRLGIVAYRIRTQDFSKEPQRSLRERGLRRIVTLLWKKADSNKYSFVLEH
jgi:hypothetical protein